MPLGFEEQISGGGGGCVCLFWVFFHNRDKTWNSGIGIKIPFVL